MDLSEDIDPSERHSNVLPSNLDQTMIIGEMDEGNIFDDIKLNQESTGEDKVTMTKQDLQEILDNLKTRHRAEIDAIQLE